MKIFTQHIGLILITFFSTALSSVEPPQIINTKLRITVLNALGNVVEGASVTIYEKETDYLNDDMPVQGPELTNRKGRVTFKLPAEKAYYVDARFGDSNNEGSGVITAKLEKGRINIVNTVIE